MYRIKAVIVFLLLIVASLAQGEELNDEKKHAIKELLQVTGAYQFGEMLSNAFTEQMINSLKATNPNIDPKAFTILKEEVESMIHEELVVKESLLPFMYPIYHKYLTLEETKGLVDFYNTPLGKKAIAVMPKMTREGMVAGQQWGKMLVPKLQERITSRFKEEGVEIKE